MVMTTWIMTMATHITKCRMTIQSARNYRLPRKSLENQILQELLPLMCLHRHETHHLRHRSALAKLNAAKMRRVPPW